MRPWIYALLPGLQAVPMSENVTWDLRMCQLFASFPLRGTQLVKPCTYRGLQGQVPRCKCMSGGQSCPVWMWLCQRRPWGSALMTVMEATRQNQVVFVGRRERRKINGWFGGVLAAAFKWFDEGSERWRSVVLRVIKNAEGRAWLESHVNAQKCSSPLHPSLDYSHSRAICCVLKIKCNYWRMWSI